MPNHDDSTKAAPPFHDGEAAVHERYGIADRIAQVGRAVIRGAMPAQHREFFAQLPMLVVGSLDAARRPWASILTGKPGFVHAPDDRTLAVAAAALPGDPLGRNLAVGTPVGILGIELSTRRRNRMNGTIASVDAAGFSVSVDQSYGNCPQYIQVRDIAWQRDAASASPATEKIGPLLDDDAAAIVRRADTLFVASASAAARGHAGPEGVDVSHRGGKPGFVRMTTDGARSVLAMPDFRGNFLFNTLGNLVSWPRAGLVFVDFDSGDLLQLTGTTEIVWDGPEVESYTGAQRIVKFTVEEGRRHRAALPFGWSAPEFAAQLAATGTWGPSVP